MRYIRIERLGIRKKLHRYMSIMYVVYIYNCKWKITLSSLPLEVNVKISARQMIHTLQENQDKDDIFSFSRPAKTQLFTVPVEICEDRDLLVRDLRERMPVGSVS